MELQFRQRTNTESSYKMLCITCLSDKIYINSINICNIRPHRWTLRMAISSFLQDLCYWLGLYIHCGAWWLIGRVDACQPEGHGIEWRSSHHVETLGKSFTRNCLWRFGVKL